MIAIENITKQFPLAGKTISVLKGISTNIQKGEFVSIMGPSGSGKSTLSSILGCLAAPSSGRYLLMGEDVSKAGGDKLAKIRNKHIGFIFQDFSLLEGISVVENVMLPLFYVGIGRSAARKKALERLDQVGLGHRINYLPRQLSGGQKQRVAVARALVNDPLFLFADEPTGALDSRTGIEIMGLIQKLNALGHTVVQVTHSLHHCNFGKRILYLVDGLIVRDETVQRPIFALDEVEDKTTANLVNNIWRLGLAASKQEGAQADFAELKRFYEAVKEDHKCLLEAPQLFCQLATPDALHVARELFAHKDWAIRAEVIKYCKSFGREEACTFYLKGLADDNEWVRFLAVGAFRGVPVEQISRVLQDALVEKTGDKDERIRATILVIIAGWKRSDLKELVIKGLSDPDGRVRANAIEALEIMVTSNSERAELLKPLLKDSNNRARANAIKGLLSVDKQAALEDLHKMIVDENNLMRVSAAWVLRFLSKSEAAEVLVNRLTKEKEEGVLSQIIGSLQQLLGEGITLAQLLVMIDSSALSQSKG